MDDRLGPYDLSAGHKNLGFVNYHDLHRLGACDLSAAAGHKNLRRNVMKLEFVNYHDLLRLGACDLDASHEDRLGPCDLSAGHKNLNYHDLHRLGACDLSASHKHLRRNFVMDLGLVKKKELDEIPEVDECLGACQAKHCLGQARPVRGTVRRCLRDVKKFRDDSSHSTKEDAKVKETHPGGPFVYHTLSDGCRRSYKGMVRCILCEQFGNLGMHF